MTQAIFLVVTAGIEVGAIETIIIDPDLYSTSPGRIWPDYLFDTRVQKLGTILLGRSWDIVALHDMHSIS